MNYMKRFKIGQSKSELIVSLCGGNITQLGAI